MQRGDDVGGFGAQLVAHRDRADRGAVAFDEHDGGALLLEAVHRVGQVARIDEPGLADTHRGTVDGAGHAVPGDGVNVGRGRGRSGRGSDRCGEGVVTGGLESGRPRNDLAGIDTGAWRRRR